MSTTQAAIGITAKSGGRLIAAIATCIIHSEPVLHWLLKYRFVEIDEKAEMPFSHFSNELWYTTIIIGGKSYCKGRRKSFRHLALAGGKPMYLR